MAANPTTTFFMKLKDYSKEVGTLAIRTAPVSATTVVEMNANPLTGDALDFYNTVAAITNGVIMERGFTFRRKTANTPPASSLSRRETKWLIQYNDVSTFANYTAEIPCADVSDNTWFKPNTDEVNIAVAPWGGAGGYIEQLEAFMRSPDGNAIAIQGVIATGRNL